MKFALIGLAAALSLPLCSPTLYAQTAQQRDVSSLLFENQDWVKAPPGTKITYAYSRKTFGSSVYGASFDDTIKETLEAGDDAKARKVEVQMFSGPHRVSAGPFPSTTTNPVLLLMFENHLQELTHLFHANPRYLKNRIRKAWRETPKIEDVSLNVGGKMVPGTRITIHPFVNDAMKEMMQGLDTLTYVVDIAESVPGEIVHIDIHAPAEGAPKYSETLSYVAETSP